MVVLMSPSLPRRWFDLCIVPEHDGVPASENTLVSRGALNRARPSGARSPELGLVLVGGPSRHHGWAGEPMRARIETIARRRPTATWTVALSPRTPPGLAEELRGLDLGNLEVVPFDAVDANWLPAQLARAGAVWVSEDSISMVYEAVTAGAPTGLLAMPPRRDRARGGRRDATARLRTLIADGLVTPYDAWMAGRELRAPDEPFDESGRCASWIVDTWLRPAR